MDDLPLHQYIPDILGINDEGKDVAREDFHLHQSFQEFIRIDDPLQETHELMQHLSISDKHVIDTKWLQHPSSHLPSDISQHALHLLKNNEDPGNELLDLLGHDNVELIVRIIENRQNILKESEITPIPVHAIAPAKREGYPHIHGNPPHLSHLIPNMQCPLEHPL